MIYNSSWGKRLDKFTNTVNPKSQLFHSRHLLVHLLTPKHFPLLNEQQRLSLLQEICIKKHLFCIPKTPFRMMQPSQTITTYSLVRHISTISTTNHHLQRVAYKSLSRLTSNTPTVLPPFGKEYMCFMKEGKSDQAAKCIKSRIMNKVIYYVLSIDTFEQPCVVLKGMLKSP